jgi:hypothetical protein
MVPCLLAAHALILLELLRNEFSLIRSRTNENVQTGALGGVLLAVYVEVTA